MYYDVRFFKSFVWSDIKMSIILRTNYFLMCFSTKVTCTMHISTAGNSIGIIRNKHFFNLEKRQYLIHIIDHINFSKVPLWIGQYTIFAWRVTWYYAYTVNNVLLKSYILILNKLKRKSLIFIFLFPVKYFFCFPVNDVHYVPNPFFCYGKKKINAIFLLRHLFRSLLSLTCQSEINDISVRRHAYNILDRVYSSKLGFLGLIRKFKNNESFLKM